jgi:iron complex outermembrane recepter protein
MKHAYTLFAFLCLLCGSVSLAAQTVISGKVKDRADGTALAGATIQIKGTVNGAVSRADGSFSINTKETLPLTLRISYQGYSELELEVNSNTIDIELSEDFGVLPDLLVSANRVEEKITQSPVTVEKISGRRIALSPGYDSYAALQNIKGVDLLAQSLTFRSVNMRGFGANNNNRFVQWVDGMDNRSPGLGFGFGNVAGPSDLDLESIEILPGASSALYGPDALQGLMLTTTKSPFKYQGLSAGVKVGMNNVGKTDFGPKPYFDVALRYAKKLGDRLAFKVNLQAIRGTDFIADDYNDRSTRGRRNFFVVDQNTKEVRIGYTPNNNPAANFEYDGVNIYGDDVTNGGSFDFPANFANADLAGKRVTRTGYTEFDLINEDGKVYSYRANAALHYRISDKLEASASWYYGNGNFIRTAGFREYFPDYKRNQFKLELKGDEFFVRGYNSSQTAEGYSLGVLAQRLLASAKTTNNWAADFAKAYTRDIGAARAAADAGKLLPGTAGFDSAREKLISTPNNKSSGVSNFNGVQLLDNSDMYHAEGMYNFKKLLPKTLEALEVITGASYRFYDMETQGTIFPATADGSEFTIQEFGWYLQGAYNLKLTDKLSFKPIAAVRYDKNEYFPGGFTPRVSGVFTLGDHNLRASWQSAFRNPSANQLLADGKIGEVGGSEAALTAANLFQNPAYTEASAKAYQTGNDPAVLVKYVPKPEDFTTEKIKTWEIGYKTLLGGKLYVDAFLYRSVYNDFIATQNYYQPINNKVEDLKSSSTYRTYQINFNNFNEIFVNGWGAGVEYAFGKGYNVGFNYANQVGLITLKDNVGATRKDAFGNEIVKRKMSDPVVSQVGRNFFISPEHRFNITFSNPKVTKRIGYNVAFRWTSEMWVEQGNTQGDVMLPSWTSVDAALTYAIPSVNGSIKIGGSNLLNNYYSQGYGLAQIGGIYYVGFTVDGI